MSFKSANEILLWGRIVSWLFILFYFFGRNSALRHATDTLLIKFTLQTYKKEKANIDFKLVSFPFRRCEIISFTNFQVGTRWLK